MILTRPYNSDSRLIKSTPSHSYVYHAPRISVVQRLRMQRPTCTRLRVRYVRRRAVALPPKKKTDAPSQIASGRPGHISCCSGRCATNRNQTPGYRGKESDFVRQRLRLGGARAQPRSNRGACVASYHHRSHVSDQGRSSASNDGQMARGKFSHDPTIRTYRFCK